MRLVSAFGAAALGVLSLARPLLAGQRGSSSDSTRENLDAAMHGEAFAYLKYSLYAEQARREGHPEIGAVFDAAARQERTEHFAELAEIFGLAGSTSDNLADAVAGETHEAKVMYPAFAATARAEGRTDAAERFSEIAADEQAHAQQFSSLLDSLQQSIGSSGR